MIACLRVDQGPEYSSGLNSVQQAELLSEVHVLTTADMLNEYCKEKFYTTSTLVEHFPFSAQKGMICRLYARKYGYTGALFRLQLKLKC